MDWRDICDDGVQSFCLLAHQYPFLQLSQYSTQIGMTNILVITSTYWMGEQDAGAFVLDANDDEASKTPWFPRVKSFRSIFLSSDKKKGKLYTGYK